MKQVYIVIGRHQHNIFKIFDTREKAIKWINNDKEYDWQVWSVE